MPSAPLLVAVTMPPCLPGLPFLAFLPLALRPPGSVPPAFLPLPGCPAMLPGPPVLVVPLSSLALVGRHAAGLPALSVSVPVAPVAPVVVPLLPLLALDVAQGRAAEAALHAGLRRLARLSAAWPRGFLVMVVVVIVVGGSAAVVDVLAPVLLVQRQLARLGLVGVVVAVVLRVDHQWPVQVGLHITTSFPWVGHLGWGNRVADGMSGCCSNLSYILKGSIQNHKEIYLPTYL